MHYREKLAAVVDLQADKLLKQAKGKEGLTSEDFELLERLCRCAKVLGEENGKRLYSDEELGLDDETLLKLAEGSQS